MFGEHIIFIHLLRKQNLLSYFHSGKFWLTWPAIAIITLMDEFTSIFYVPAEAYRFIGPSAIVFIALTSLLIRFMSTRFTEIAEILEYHGLIGGGVYSFSYLVLGPMMSFVAVSSIMADYTLTACISAVSAVLNVGSFFPQMSGAPNLLILVVLGLLSKDGPEPFPVSPLHAELSTRGFCCCSKLSNTNCPIKKCRSTLAGRCHRGWTGWRSA